MYANTWRAAKCCWHTQLFALFYQFIFAVTHSYTFNVYIGTDSFFMLSLFGMYFSSKFEVTVVRVRVQLIY